MQDFKLCDKYILNKSDLSHHDISKYLDAIKNKSVDYSDIYFQFSKNEFWSLEDGVVKNGSFSIDQGVGIRSILGEQTAFLILMKFLLLHLNLLFRLLNQ